MKNLFLTLLAVAVVIGCVFSGCEKEETELSINGIKNFSHTGCKNTKESESIRFKMISSSELKIEHKNLMLNCEPGEIIAKAQLTMDSIILNEYNTENRVDCICPYDLDYIVDKICYGKFIISLQLEGYEHNSFNIELTENTDTTIILN